MLFLASGKHVHEMYTPLNPNYYIEKLGFAGVNLFFFFLIKNIDCGYSLEQPHLRLGEAVLTCATINVLSNNIKNIKNFLMKFSIFIAEKKSVYYMGMFTS